MILSKHGKYVITTVVQHGEMERTLDQLQDENSKLQANLAVLQNKQDSQMKEVEEERETTAMFKAEAERDIKLQKQVFIKGTVQLEPPFVSSY